MSSLTKSQTLRLPDSLNLESNSVGDANELTPPVSDAIDGGEITQNFDSISNSMPNSMTIKELVASSECSVRLTNAILSATSLPAETIWDYMKAPESMYSAFMSNIRNMGCKSTSELDSLIKVAHESDAQMSFDFNQESQMASISKQDNVLRVVQGLLSGLKFPQDVLDEDINVRIQNVLTRRYKQENECFFEILTNFRQLSTELLREPGFGRVCLYELTEIMESIIRRRLSIASIDPCLASTFISSVSGTKMDEELLKAFESVNPLDYTDIAKKEKELRSEITIEDFFTERLATLLERERDVISRRFGINYQNTQTLQEIADIYELTRERVRQLEVKAKKKLLAGKAHQLLKSTTENANLVEKLFHGRKGLGENQLRFALKNLNSFELLAIDLCFGKIWDFLNDNAMRIKGGWTLDVDELPANPKIFIGSTRERILLAILEGALPLSIDDIADRLVDFATTDLRDELARKFDAQFKDGIIYAAPKLPSRIRYILILRSKGRSMTLSEIRTENYKIFRVDESIQHIQARLRRMNEALIVARGTYNLHENLSLTCEVVANVCDQVFEHLNEVGSFVSVKVIYKSLFQNSAFTVSNEFSYYMLLGMLQDDFRFDLRPGLMVGLRSFESHGEFMGLGEEAFAVLCNSPYPMSLNEIAKALEARRDTFLSSLSLSLDRMPQAVAIGKSRYAVVANVFGDQTKQENLIDSCSIVLASGDKSVVALVEIIEPICGEQPVYALRNFLQKFTQFLVKGSIVHLVNTPQQVGQYLSVRDSILEQVANPSVGIERIKSDLKFNKFRDFTHLDPMFASR